MTKTLLLRYAEIGLKSAATRKWFVKVLKANFKAAAKQNKIKNLLIKYEQGRFFVSSDNLEQLKLIVKNIFGIDSFSECDVLRFKNLDDLAAQIQNLGTDYFHVSRGTYAVRVNRVGQHDFSSKDAEISLGSVLNTEFNKVDLGNPNQTVHLEIRDNIAYVFTKKIKGPGGMPLGTGGRAISLFSGGIDSPVASYLTMKRGVQIDFLLYNPLGQAYEQKVLRVLKTLVDNYAFGYEPQLYIVNGQEIEEQIKQQIPEKFRQVIFKIVLLKLAEQIIKDKSYHGIVTGESLAQKSSQTLQNLEVINSYTDRLILRPLLTYDKKEIVNLARKISTLELSELVPEMCRLSQGPVATRAKTHEIQALPKFEDLIATAASQARIMSITEINFKNTESKPLTALDKYVIIDIRTPQVRIIKPLKSNLQFESADFLIEKNLKQTIKKLKKNAQYLLVCSHGNKGEAAAEMLNELGFKAQGISFQDLFKQLR